MSRYEAATLLDGHPAPHPTRRRARRSGCSSIDRAVVFDHWRQRLVLVVHAPAGGYDGGVAALEELAAKVADGRAPAARPAATATARRAASRTWTTRTTARIVASFKEHILAGDIFQGVPSRRVSFPAPDGGLPIYRRLRVSNPAPYMFFLRMLGMELAGSSPEPLVRVEGRRVSTRPIAGTRPRGLTEVRDRLLEHELLADPKEQAEHAMLVDLARNDLGRVCVPGTVRPTELMEVERFSKVMHIVSTVEGDLRHDMEPFDALAVTFPAGTVTGAPKRRAMELIAESRADAAGAVRRGGRVPDVRRATSTSASRSAPRSSRRPGDIQAGAGVVADSDPETELRRDQREGRRAAPGGRTAMEAHADDPRRRSLRLFTYNLVQLIESLGRATIVVKSDEKPADALVAREARRGRALARPGPSPRRGVLHRSCSSCCRGRRRYWACASGTRRSGSRRAARWTAPRRCTGRRRWSTTKAAASSKASACPFEAGRYHSLVVERDDLPEELELTAWTDDGLVMATQHRELPRFGVQFHPESILTPEGPRIVENFLALALIAYGSRTAGAVRERPAVGRDPARATRRRRRTLAPGSA